MSAHVKPTGVQPGLRNVIRRAWQGLRGDSARKGLIDDFDWTTYSALYRGEVQQLSATHTLRLNTGDYEYREGNLCKVRNGIKPLHFNHRLLYETILQLRPNSVVELGCGAGDHSRNLTVLGPGLRVRGYDLSPDQLAFLRERNPQLNPEEFHQMDLTLPVPERCPKHDVAFTQAVIMHIHAGKGHLVALANAFRLARNQVVLMENWSRHDFMEDVRLLYGHEVINWPGLYFYLRRSPERENRPHLMVVSSVPIPEYEPLTEYRTLTDNMGEK